MFHMEDTGYAEESKREPTFEKHSSEEVKKA